MNTETDLQKAQRKVSEALDKAKTADDISKLGNTLAKLVIAAHKLEESTFGEAFEEPTPEQQPVK
jgi:hypothetical protein